MLFEAFAYAALGGAVTLFAGTELSWRRWKRRAAEDLMVDVPEKLKLGMNRQERRIAERACVREKTHVSKWIAYKDTEIYVCTRCGLVQKVARTLDGPRTQESPGPI